MTPLDIGRVRRAFPDRRVEYYSSIDSTMNAAAGLATGSLVVAEEQTAGQGRHGRAWHSEPGSGIYCSIALESKPALTLALALAARAAIAAAAAIECDIRWPNDLLLGGKKTAGILVQAAGDRAVAGIGINVNHASFPPALAQEATSLFLSGGGAVLSREEILLALIPAIDAHVQLDRETILELFTMASSYVSGRRVAVQQPEGPMEGVTAGLDPSGFLKVRRNDGSEALILAGGVRAAGA
ncbi:MAG: biotin--[acetyl-CoA-carboxylase] ligase [Bryobacteraceae bacterium]|jgi:BirA family biotin operon repressor/biotin-[acetyl-CoA-carboxylase] ligase